MHNGRACTTRGCTDTFEHEAAMPPMDNPKIVIVGAGPTGLCAAYRLTELGYTNWKLIEGSAEPAGLACTIKDQAG
jgi:monoamine oxidase